MCMRENCVDCGSNIKIAIVERMQAVQIQSDKHPRSLDSNSCKLQCDHNFELFASKHRSHIPIRDELVVSKHRNHIPIRAQPERIVSKIHTGKLVRELG